MSLTKDEMLEVMTKFKELGLTTFKAEGIELGNTPTPVAQAVAPVKAKPAPIPEDVKPEEIVTPMAVFDEIDDELIQYWSTPYYDEIMAKRADMASARNAELPNTKRTEP